MNKWSWDSKKNLYWNALYVFISNTWTALQHTSLVTAFDIWYILSVMFLDSSCAFYNCENLSCVQNCNVCQKQFANVHRLQRHMISHNESEMLRRFKCEECAKKFKFKHHLKVSWVVFKGWLNCAWFGVSPAATELYLVLRY